MMKMVLMSARLFNRPFIDGGGMIWAKLWELGDAEFVDILMHYEALHSDFKKMAPFNVSGIRGGSTVEELQSQLDDIKNLIEKVVKDQEVPDPKTTFEELRKHRIAADILFTRQIKPEVESDWTISSLNYWN